MSWRVPRSPAAMNLPSRAAADQVLSPVRQMMPNGSPVTRSTTAKSPGLEKSAKKATPGAIVPTGGIGGGRRRGLGGSQAPVMPELADSGQHRYGRGC